MLTVTIPISIALGYLASQRIEQSDFLILKIDLWFSIFGVSLEDSGRGNIKPRKGIKKEWNHLLESGH